MIKVFFTIIIGLGYKLRTKPKCITNIKFSNILSITIVWFQKTSIPPTTEGIGNSGEVGGRGQKPW